MYRIKSKYFWPSMLKDVSEFFKTCHLCQSRKGSNQLPSGLLQPIPPANFPFERIGIDFVGPLPSTKNRKKWIIVLTDYYTRYAETKAVSEATVKEVSKFLVEDIFLRHGAPQYLISDRGSQFTSNLMKEVMKTCKIKHCFTTSYHPQTNGLTERLNRTLINMLSMYVNTDQKNWDEILPFITHAYNTTIQETTGYSPFFLMFGREPTSLLDDRNISVDIDKDDYDEYIKHHLDKINRTRKLVINNTIKTQERMKKNYDKKHMERSYEPGELVAVWTPIRKIEKCEKLLRKYFGPYRILKKLSNVNYLIEPKDNPGQDPLIVHVSRIKPYFERIDEVNHEDVTTSGEGEVMVETRSGKMQDPAQERIVAEESAKPQPDNKSKDKPGQLATFVRSIPFAIEANVKKELDEMEALGIIKKVNHPTPISSHMVIVRKDGKIRICLDPSDFNKILLRREFPLKRLEDIAVPLHKSKYFTKLDLKKSFWQLPVDEETQPYLTFSTPWGRYSFLRVPFGIKTAPEIMQQIMTDLLSDLKGVENSMDDILIHAPDLDTLRKRTYEVLSLLKSTGIKLNKEKCVFEREQVKFLGHLISKEGIQIDPGKVKAINDIQSPRNRKELQRLIDQLLVWNWDPSLDNDLEEIKIASKKAPALKFFNPNAALTMSVDASSHAIGAVLMQDNRPIAFASATLIDYQRNYPQIEKEALAIKFGC
ncbi:K02A2.6-like [Cordylochernes scorpioides]|uniref:RNA-directed DNA polymerase n=1 Tax=Cordylochernes scorpioides TaxID=51811 RepID=A0ABY6L1H8_9ARAC|nr:K02A2.6-like [Cordylochernes scorpioides]